MSVPRLYPCPMCGRPESSYGDNFCGRCETKHQRDMELLRKMEAEERARELERLYR